MAGVPTYRKSVKNLLHLIQPDAKISKDAMNVIIPELRSIKKKIRYVSRKLNRRENMNYINAIDNATTEALGALAIQVMAYANSIDMKNLYLPIERIKNKHQDLSDNEARYFTGIIQFVLLDLLRKSLALSVNNRITSSKVKRALLNQMNDKYHNAVLPDFSRVLKSGTSGSDKKK